MLLQRPGLLMVQRVRPLVPALRMRTLLKRVIPLAVLMRKWSMIPVWKRRVRKPVTLEGRNETPVTMKGRTGAPDSVPNPMTKAPHLYSPITMSEPFVRLSGRNLCTSSLFLVLLVFGIHIYILFHCRNSHFCQTVGKAIH